jgi:hypothetical protein
MQHALGKQKTEKKFVGKPQEKILPMRPRHEWEGIIKTDPKQTICEPD